MGDVVLEPPWPELYLPLMFKSLMFKSLMLKGLMLKGLVRERNHSIMTSWRDRVFDRVVLLEGDNGIYLMARGSVQS